MRRTLFVMGTERHCLELTDILRILDIECEIVFTALKSAKMEIDAVLRVSIPNAFLEKKNRMYILSLALLLLPCYCGLTKALAYLMLNESWINVDLI